MSRTRILLADDNSAILEHESQMLRDDGYEIVGRIADGASVRAGVEELRPDVVILDISMGEHNGIEICRDLQDHGFPGKVVFLTVLDDPDFVNAAIGAGGRGYVIKSRMTVDLEKAVQTALSQGIFISPPLLRR